MGIYDRDYYRNDGRSVFDPFTTRTKVCIALIIINVVAFLIQLATREQVLFGRWLPGPFTEAFVLNIDKVMQGEVWRLLTHAFLHSTQDISHIIFNMLLLWWFGSMVEDIYGSKEFLAFYLTAAIMAGLGYLIIEKLNDSNHSALGASGAVSAVILLYACHYPHKTILLFFILPIPVWLFVVFNILNDVFGLLGGHKLPIAFAAHLSGTLFGFLYYWFSWRIMNWLPDFSFRRSQPKRANKNLKLFQPSELEEEAPTKPEPIHAPMPATTPQPVSANSSNGKSSNSQVDEHLEAKVDEVLEKVKKHGQSSLSESEREILFRASEIYKKRRKTD